jgi:hypothetical protein
LLLLSAIRAQAVGRRFLSAIEFLALVDAKGLKLAALTQGDVDMWITTGRPGRRHVHAFLQWTAARHLT